jgi:large subunit ribosomal protein L13
MKEYTIDAKGRALGRVASEAAAILRGKNDASFQENIAPDIKLTVLNVNEIKLTGQKSKQKEYKTYAGYPGSLKATPIERAIGKKGKAFVFKTAVLGMLPKSKLQIKMIKNLFLK